MRSSAKGAPVGRKVGEAKTEGTKDGEGDGTDVGEGVGWYVGEGEGFTEKGPVVILFGNGGEESILGDSVDFV